MPPKKNERGEASGGGGQAPGGGGNIERPVKPDILKNFPKDEKPNFFLRLPTLAEEDDIKEEWADAYRSAIQNMRRSASSDERFYEDRGDIYRLPLSTKESILHNYSLVLYNSDSVWIVLYFRCQDLYLRGFRNSTGCFQFKDDTRTEDKTWTKLWFDGSYTDLIRVGGRKDLLSIKMGQLTLTKALLNLSEVTSDNKNINEETKALGLRCMVIAFSEGARFQCLCDFFASCDFEPKAITADHVNYIEFWAKISKILIAAKAKPDKISAANAEIEKMGLLLFDTYMTATCVEEVNSVIRVLSGQTEEDSLALLAGKEVSVAPAQAGKDTK